MTPTPEEFLAQTEPDEVDLPDPLESIADSLRTLVTTVQKHEAADSAVEGLERELEKLEEAYQSLKGQLDQVRAICKPSTSKLANAIREVLDPGEAAPVEEPVAPEPVPCVPGCLAVGDHTATGCVTHPEQPLHDAPVEEWREYARDLGHDVSDTANRSKIRTMLGIQHPTTGEES